MEAVRANLFCIIQFHLNFELFAADRSRKPVVTDGLSCCDFLSFHHPQQQIQVLSTAH